MSKKTKFESADSAILWLKNHYDKEVIIEKKNITIKESIGLKGLAVCDYLKNQCNYVMF